MSDSAAPRAMAVQVILGTEEHAAIVSMEGIHDTESMLRAAFDAIKEE